MARYRVLSWDGIPAQVKAYGDDRRKVSAPLPEDFTQYIDRVAMRRGLHGSDDFLQRWAWSEDREREGEPAEVAAAVVAELTERWWDEVDAVVHRGEPPGSAVPR